MRELTSRPTTDPFATLVSLTAAALTGVGTPSRSKAAASEGGESLLDRLDRWLWKTRQDDLERALANATDLADLEARLRARERGVLHRYY